MFDIEGSIRVSILAFAGVSLGGCATTTNVGEPHVVHCAGEHLALESDGEHREVFDSTHKGVECITTTKLSGEYGYAVAYRHDDGIAIGALTPNHAPIGGLVALSRARDASQPILTPNGEGVLVAWADRARNADPWRVHLVRWVPGAGVKTLDDQVAPTRTDAPPHLAWSRDASGAPIVNAQPLFAMGAE